MVAQAAEDSSNGCLCLLADMADMADNVDNGPDFHNLRHAFETWLVEHDVPSPVQKELMGHSSSSCQTEDYAHPSVEKMRECVNRLPRLLLRCTFREKPGASAFSNRLFGTEETLPR